MKSIFICYLWLIIGSTYLLGQTATAPSTGDGSEDAPYQIASLDNLYWLSQNDAEWGKCFIQTADINAAATSTWDSGSGWSPIGNGITSFSGSYDGQGHIITHLFVDRTGSYMGFFGKIDHTIIKNLGLESIDITGDRRIGGIVGSSYYSSIEYCYTTGNVAATSDMVGGIVGENYVDGTIRNCYSRCAIATTSLGGGITGTNGNLCKINSCYSTGTVTGTSNIGGISGYGYDVAANCFWDTSTSGIVTSIGGTGVNTTTMIDLATFTDTTTTGLEEAWDFPGYPNDDKGTESIWEIDAGLNNGYPTLSWQYASTATVLMHSIDSIKPTEAYISYEITNDGGTSITASGLCWGTVSMPTIADAHSIDGTAEGIFTGTMSGLSSGLTYYVRTYVTNSEGTTYGNQVMFKTTAASGDGTEANPYEISSLAELAWLMGNQNVWDKHFVQTASIDASGSQDWFGYKGFNPIGTSTKNFTGSYNGRGYAINNLYFNRPDDEYVALFGEARSAMFDSVSITNIDGNAGENKVGSILGSGIDVSITNSSCSGTLSGSTGGGIAGYLGTSTINNCYANCEVNASQGGGLLGTAGSSTVIKNSHSDGTVNVVNYAGGLVGLFRADSVINCYSTATVNCEGDYAGGLIGFADQEPYIAYCYSTSDVQGVDNVGGLIGFLGSDSYVKQSYSEGNITGTNYIGGLIGACATTDTIINCYSHASATASSSKAGGLIGQIGTNTVVLNCYSTGIVSALTNKGGLIGNAYSNAVENCFWNTETSGLGTSSGGTGKTTPELKDTTTFTHEATDGLTSAWDFFKNPGDDNHFLEVWHIDPVYNNSYPFFVKPLIPAIQTVEATNIACDSLTSGGMVISEGTTPVKERGLCWSTVSPPTALDNIIKSGDGLGTFTENITQLDTNIIYYIRAYAINDYDTSYGFIDTVATLKAEQIITFNTLANLTYGDPAYKLGASSNAGLDITYTSSDPTVAEISNDTIFIAGVGVTTITATQPGNSNYAAAADVEQELTIVKDTLWVTAHDKSKVYGATPPELSYFYSDFAYDEDSTVIDVQPTISCPVTSATNAGNQVITISGASDDNYFVNHINGMFTVYKDTLTLTAHDKTREYGEGNPELTMTYSGFISGEDVSVIDEEPEVTTTADTLSDVGMYNITFTGGNDNNYTFNHENALLTITEAPLYASGGSYFKNYGEVNPEIIIEYSGFKNNEDETVIDEAPAALTAADETTVVGNYPITLSGGNDNNYTIFHLDGSITIEKATLNVRAVDTTRNYGEANPEFRIEYSGFVNDEDISVLDELPVVSTTANNNSDPGVYSITLNGGNDDNYYLSLQDGYLTIPKLVQEITFNLPDSVPMNTQYIELDATTTSGLEIMYESSNTSVAYVDGDLLYIVSEGNAMISAMQEGNAIYNSQLVEKPFKVYGGASSIITNSLNSLKIYPNPVQDKITIESSERIERIEVLDMYGRLLKQDNFLEGGMNHLYLSQLKTGQYFLKVYAKNIPMIIKIVKK